MSPLAQEPLTFGLRPETVADYLEERGLRLESDIGAENYRRRYYGEISATMHGHEFYRVAHAQLAPLRIEAQTP